MKNFWTILSDNWSGGFLFEHRLKSFFVSLLNFEREVSLFQLAIVTFLSSLKKYFLRYETISRNIFLCYKLDRFLVSLFSLNSWGLGRPRGHGTNDVSHEGRNFDKIFPILRFGDGLNVPSDEVDGLVFELANVAVLKGFE